MFLRQNKFSGVLLRSKYSERSLHKFMMPTSLLHWLSQWGNDNHLVPEFSTKHTLQKTGKWQSTMWLWMSFSAKDYYPTGVESRSWVGTMEFNSSWNTFVLLAIVNMPQVMITRVVFVAVSLYLISGSNLLLRERKFWHTLYPYQESQKFLLHISFLW